MVCTVKLAKKGKLVAVEGLQNHPSVSEDSLTTAIFSKITLEESELFFTWIHSFAETTLMVWYPFISVSLMQGQEEVASLEASTLTIIQSVPDYEKHFKSVYSL